MDRGAMVRVVILLFVLFCLATNSGSNATTAVGPGELAYQTAAIYPLEGTGHFLQAHSFTENQRTRAMIQIELWQTLEDGTKVRRGICFTEDGTLELENIAEADSQHDDWQAWVKRRINSAKLFIGLPIDSNAAYIFTCSS